MSTRRSAPTAAAGSGLDRPRLCSENRRHHEPGHPGETQLRKRKDRARIVPPDPTSVSRVPTYRNIQALRGIAIILVVLLHLANAELLYGDRRTALSAFAVFGAAGVDLFFVISGFVMATIVRGTFQKPGSLPLFLYSRAARIYPPYWVFSVTLLAAHQLLPALGDPQRWRELDVTRSLLLLPQFNLPILVVGWTLVLELYYYLVVALSLLLPERFFVALLLVWAGTVTAANAVLPQTTIVLGPAAFVAIYPQAIEFIVGCLLARLVEVGLRRWGTLCFSLGATLLPALYAGYAAGRPGYVPSAWDRCALFGVPSALMVYGACSMELSGATRLPRFLMSVGDRSYTMYLTHVPVILAVSVLCNRLADGGIADPRIAGALRAVAVGGAAALGYVAVERPLHRTMRQIRERWQARPRTARPA